MRYPTFATLDEACRCVGIDPTVRRCAASGFVSANITGDRAGKGDGRIRYFRDNKGGIVFNWKTGSEAVFIYGYDGQKPTRAELRKRNAEIRRERIQFEAETRKRQGEVARLAVRIIESASGSAQGHQYLQRKGLSKYGRQFRAIRAETVRSLIDAAQIDHGDGSKQMICALGRLLVIPLIDAAGKVWSVQLIDESGNKTFLKGGRKKGLFWCPLELLNANKRLDAIGIAEGVATALSVTELYGVPCVAAIDAGNLESAAMTLLKRFGRCSIRFYADRDESGVGEEKAKAAARSLLSRGIKCSVCLPPFTERMDTAFKKRTGKTASDFNDYWQLWSKEYE